MKTLLLSLVIFLIVLSCADYTIMDDDFWTLNKEYSIESVKDIQRIKITHITDPEYHGKLDLWQTPYETENLGHGDCEDKAILHLCIAYTYLNKKGKILLVDSSGDGIINHAMYRIDNIDYNKSILYNSYSVIEIIEFDDIPEYSRSRR